MQALIEKHIRRISHIKPTFERSAIEFLNLDHRLLGIAGARGTGKTTMLLQHARKQPDWQSTTLYASLDDFWFATRTPSSLADEFAKRGGQLLLLDEVHKCPDWARHLKNIYDDLPDLKVVFTGSSLLEILNARVDLSRRAVMHRLQGLSFREYFGIAEGRSFSQVKLSEILEDHVKMAANIVLESKPLQHFDTYLRRGYYPFFRESKKLYYDKLEAVVQMILEIELPLMRSVDIAYVPRIKQLMVIMAESAPFTPNVTKLAERIGISRKTTLEYMRYLEDAGLLMRLFKEAKGISRLQKPDKIYLENANLGYLLSPRAEIGTIRETFFANQLRHTHSLYYPDSGDFKVDGRYLFEVGGKNENRRSTTDEKKIIHALDGIEIGHGNTIPLWLFGFLY